MENIPEYLGSIGTALLLLVIVSAFAASLPWIIEAIDRWKKARNSNC